MTRYQVIIKIGISSIIAVAVICFSVYFRPLDKELEERQLNTFRPHEYARHFWDHVLLTEAKNAVDATELMDSLIRNPDVAFKQFGKTLGISDMSNFLMKGRGQVTAVTEEFIELRLCKSNYTLKINTGMVFGNVLRDCTGSIRMDDFKNSMDFNNISVEINKIVNAEIIPDLKQKAAEGDFVYFEGAAGIMKGITNTDTIELIPVRLILSDDCKE